MEWQRLHSLIRLQDDDLEDDEEDLDDDDTEIQDEDEEIEDEDDEEDEEPWQVRPEILEWVAIGTPVRHHFGRRCLTLAAGSPDPAVRGISPAAGRFGS